jgi:AAA domain, putative AbiEii toxin, Type IV TA system
MPAIYLRECLIQNLGPITALDLSFELDSNGNPKPIVLVGKNGTGKTILLAYVLDALVELAKAQFGDIVLDQRIGHMPFLKVSSSGDTRSLSGHHLCLLEFDASDKRCSYIEKVGVIDPKSVSDKLRSRFDRVRNWPEEEPFHKRAVGDKKLVESAFQLGVICFFPASRHERPHWLNQAAVEDQPVFGDYSRMQGQLQKPLVVERAAENNQQWLMDVFLDSMIDFDLVPQTGPGSVPAGQVAIRPRTENVQEKVLLTLGRKNVEQLLCQVLEDDHAQLILNYRNAAFGRMGIRLGSGITVPSLTHLSAGQSLLFNLFATIIRYADRGDLNKSFQLNQIEGIVLIDEIDAHLHSDLQFSVLPRLLKLFPKIQFIVTSHAPLFLLGLEREFGTAGVQIVEMPTGRMIGTDRFEEFRRSFEVYRQTKAFEQEVENQLLQATKPLVLTEGQTDPVFIRTALELLGCHDLLVLVEIDQVGSSGRGGASGGGDSHLNKARTFLQHNHQRFNRRVLLLYDNDTGKPAAGTGSLIQRAIPKNPSNSRVPSGIENLLPEALFENRFYSVQEKPRADGGVTSIKSLKKEEFCRWICEERRNPTDFTAFGTHLVPILREFVGSAANS